MIYFNNRNGSSGRLVGLFSDWSPLLSYMADGNSSLCLKGRWYSNSPWEGILIYKRITKPWPEDYTSDMDQNEDLPYREFCCPREPQSENQRKLRKDKYLKFAKKAVEYRSERETNFNWHQCGNGAGRIRNRRKNRDYPNLIQTPVSFPRPWRLIPVCWVLLVSLPLSCSTAFSSLWQDEIICRSICDLSYHSVDSLEQQNPVVTSSFFLLIGCVFMAFNIGRSFNAQSFLCIYQIYDF